MLSQVRHSVSLAALSLFALVSFAGTADAAGTTLTGTLEVDTSYYPGPGYPESYFFVKTASGKVYLPVGEKNQYLRSTLAELAGAEVVVQGTDVTGTAFPLKGRTYKKAAFELDVKAPLLVKGRLEAATPAASLGARGTAEEHRIRFTQHDSMGVEGVDFLDPNIGSPVWAKVKLESWVLTPYPETRGGDEMTRYYNAGDNRQPLKAISFLPIGASDAQRRTALADSGANVGRDANTTGTSAPVRARTSAGRAAGAGIPR